MRMNEREIMRMNERDQAVGLDSHLHHYNHVHTHSQSHVGYFNTHSQSHVGYKDDNDKDKDDNDNDNDNRDDDNENKKEIRQQDIAYTITFSTFNITSHLQSPIVKSS